jgi:hypothetical protein
MVMLEGEKAVTVPRSSIPLACRPGHARAPPAGVGPAEPVLERALAGTFATALPAGAGLLRTPAMAKPLAARATIAPDATTARPGWRIRRLLEPRRGKAWLSKPPSPEERPLCLGAAGRSPCSPGGLAGAPHPLGVAGSSSSRIDRSFSLDAVTPV